MVPAREPEPLLVMVKERYSLIGINTLPKLRLLWLTPMEGFWLFQLIRCQGSLSKAAPAKAPLAFTKLTEPESAFLLTLPIPDQVLEGKTASVMLMNCSLLTLSSVPP